VKHVGELRESHVQQVEDGRAGLEHTFGVTTRSPLMVLRTEAAVSEEHAERVDVLRIRNRARRG
jgi:hypothetical protein